MYFKNKKENNGGLSILSMTGLAILVILALSYFNISIKSIVEDPSIPQNIDNVIQGEQTHENINYLTSLVVNFWNQNLKTPVMNFYNNIWIPRIWTPFWNDMQRIQRGEGTIFQDMSPGVPS